MNNDIQLFWAISDCSFDAFERSFLFHIFRRGVCWQSQANIAKETGMSVGKVNKLIKDLEQRDIIVWKIHHGRAGWAVNETTIHSLSEQTQQNYHSPDEYHSPSEYEHSPHECDIHSVNENVHPVNTKDNKEDNTLSKQRKNNNLSPEPWEEESQEINFKQPAEKDPLEELLEVFCELTHIPPPPSYHNGNGDKWINPMVRVYEATGEDFVKTKQCIIEAVTILKEKSYTIASPKSVLTAALSVASRLEQQELNGLFKPTAPQVDLTGYVTYLGGGD